MSVISDEDTHKQQDFQENKTVINVSGLDSLPSSDAEQQHNQKSTIIASFHPPFLDEQQVKVVKKFF